MLFRLKYPGYSIPLFFLGKSLLFFSLGIFLLINIVLNLQTDLASPNSDSDWLVCDDWRSDWPDSSQDCER